MIGLNTIERQIKIKFSRNMLELNSIAATVAKMNSFLFYLIFHFLKKVRLKIDFNINNEWLYKDIVRS